MGEPVYVALVEKGELFEIVLLDGDRQVVGHGYRGPTHRRAEQDLKYWRRTKHLEQVDHDTL